METAEHKQEEMQEEEAIKNNLSLIRPSDYKWFINSFKFFVGRLFMIVTIALLIPFQICVTDGNQLYLLFIISIVLLAAETLFVIFLQKARTSDWFSIGIFVYVITMYLVFLVNIQINVSENNLECDLGIVSNQTLRAHQKCVTLINGYTRCQFNRFLMIIFQIPLIIIRWLTPHSKRSSISQHSANIFVMLATSADIVDFIDLSHDKEASDAAGVLVIVFIGGFASLLHCVVLTRAKVVKNKTEGLKYLIDLFFGTEIWNLILIDFVLELPFLIVRSVILFKIGLGHSLLEFFWLKNVFGLLATPYRLFAIRKEFNEQIDKY